MNLRFLVCCALALSGTAPSVAAAADGAGLAPYERLARGDDGRQLLAAARRAMTAFANDGAIPSDSLATTLGWPAAPVAVYLSLVRGTTTRACVGSAGPLRGGLVETVQALAVQVLSADRRRPPVRRDELGHLRIVLAFADAPRPVRDPLEVNPAREGLLVGSERGQIAFLPGEARTVAWTLREARRAGIIGSTRDQVSYHAFSAVQLRERDDAVVDREVTDESD